MQSGRIIKGVGGLYTVATANGLYMCTARGIFRKRKITPSIGDFVDIDAVVENEKEATAIITHIHARRNTLLRPAVVNVDQAVLVFAVVRPAPNMDLLDRFILATANRDVEPLLCFNKLDLLGKNDAEAFEGTRRIYEDAGYAVCLVSAETGEGLDVLRQALRDKVSVLAGPSGAGKSSLINAILPGANLETGALSRKIQRGKHTTRHSELFEVSPNSFIVDSPGFTTIATDELNRDNLPLLFREFAPYTGQCRYADCKHLREPHCAVKAQVGLTIAPVRYKRYETLMNEVPQEVY